MKMRKFAGLVAMAMIFAFAGTTARAASEDLDRDSSTIHKMFHKLGRGVTNVLTCWVEIPRTVAREWERTDPVTGIVLGSVEGVGWGFTRFATGAFETFTFPFPIPADYAPMIQPEFVVTDTWGDGIPDINDLNSNEPNKSKTAMNSPGQFNF